MPSQPLPADVEPLLVALARRLTVRGQVVAAAATTGGEAGPAGEGIGRRRRPEPAPGTARSPRGEESPGGGDGVPEGSADVAALVRAAQAGDTDAFGLLYEGHVDLVYRFLSYRVRGAALTEDLTSEVFLRALRRVGTFRWQGREFGAWLLTIARNLIRDHYASARVRREVSTDDTAVVDRPSTAGPEALTLDRLRDDALLEVVARLSPDQQECLSLRFLEGLSVRETALVLDKTDNAVRALQYRALRSLARFLGGSEPG